MGDRRCPNYKQPVDVSRYCRRCSDEIMAASLSPQYAGRRESAHRALPATSTVQMRLNRRRSVAMYGYIRTSRDQEPDRPGMNPETQRRDLIKAGVPERDIHAGVATRHAWR